MSAKVVAIAGANGLVGKLFADAFLNLNLSLRILTRESSIESEALQAFKKRGASLYAVSYDDETSLVKALQGVDVLVSTVGSIAVVSAQISLIKAAKSADVKLFFPSEYGGVFPEDNASPIAQGKHIVVKSAKEIGLPLAVVANGAFSEYCFVPPLGYNFADKKVTIWGEGNAKVSWTTASSVGQWVANVLKTVPISQLQNKQFRIQGDLVSPNEIVALWEKKHNDKLEVDYRPLKELEDRVKADSNDFLGMVLEGWHSGNGALPGPLSNDLYPGWKPASVEDVL